jgi:hypothetical protein
MAANPSTKRVALKALQSAPHVEPGFTDQDITTRIVKNG